MSQNQTTFLEFRGKCYSCNRPASSCMCKYIEPLQTKTKFVILMHPKEHQKTKNGTGYLTHLSLPNSLLFHGVDFSNHTRINEIINDASNQCMILYPGETSVNLSKETLHIQKKNLVIFIIDSTWACSRKMLRLSSNLQQLPRVSFNASQTSQFHIKKQPANYCLSTIESTLTLIKLFNNQKIESLNVAALNRFLNPFNKMVEYQLKCAEQKNIRQINRE